MTNYFAGYIRRMKCVFVSWLVVSLSLQPALIQKNFAENACRCKCCFILSDLAILCSNVVLPAPEHVRCLTDDPSLMCGGGLAILLV